MELSGKQYIGQTLSAEGNETFFGVDPKTGASLQGAFHEATEAEVSQAMELAEVAFQAFIRISSKDRADFLDAIAMEIEALGESLLLRAASETGLPLPRLQGERGRTMNQLRLFAQVIREGSWVDARVEADALDWRPPSPAAAVLLDAPCTATGTIRRHPDIAWHKTQDDVAQMAALQGELLAAAVAMVEPGGLIVYASCSLQPEEGPAVVAKALDALPVERVPVETGEIDGLEVVGAEGDIRTLPCHLAQEGGIDGFYIARLRKR